MRVGLHNLSVRILGSFPCKTLKITPHKEDAAYFAREE